MTYTAELLKNCLILESLNQWANIPWPFNRVDQCLQVHFRLFWGQCPITGEGLVFLSYQNTDFNLSSKYCTIVWYEITPILCKHFSYVKMVQITFAWCLKKEKEKKTFTRQVMVFDVN